MFCFIMQPWKAIRCDKTITTVTQTESCWLDLTPYQDVVAWLEVKQVSPGGGTNVQMAYQTSPTKDDSLFQAVTAAFNMATGVTTTIMLKDAATVTLCRYLRWQLSVTGSPSSSWDTTFRVFVAANVIGRNRPTAVPVGTGTTPPTPPLHMQTPPGVLGGGNPSNTVVRRSAPQGLQPTASGNTAVLATSGSLDATRSIATQQNYSSATQQTNYNLATRQSIATYTPAVPATSQNRLAMFKSSSGSPLTPSKG